MLDNTHLSDMSLQFFLPVCGLSFDSLNNVFHRAEVFYFNKVQFIIFIFHAFGVISKKSLLHLRSSRFSTMLSSRSYVVLWFTCRFMIYFGLVFYFVKYIRSMSRLLLFFYMWMFSSSTICWKTVFATWHCLYSSIEDQLTN